MASKQCTQAMWLTLDIGNSAVKGALFDGTRIASSMRWSASSDVGASLEAWLEQVAVERIGVASVVPSVSDAIRPVLRQSTMAPILEIGVSLNLPIRVAYRSGDRLGADRIAAAVGAWNRAARMGPLVVVDAGSALTIDGINRNGTFLGGTIAPGAAMKLRALTSWTAALPSVPLHAPAHPYGGDTTASLQHGLVYGLVDLARGALGRWTAVFGEKPRVFLTGGERHLLADHLPEAVVDEHLVLRGIHALVESNPP